MLMVSVVVKPFYTTVTTYTAQKQVTIPKVQTVQVTTTPTNYVFTSGATSQTAASTYSPVTTFQSPATTSTVTYSGWQFMFID